MFAWPLSCYYNRTMQYMGPHSSHSGRTSRLLTNWRRSWPWPGVAFACPSFVRGNHSLAGHPVAQVNVQGQSLATLIVITHCSVQPLYIFASTGRPTDLTSGDSAVRVTLKTSEFAESRRNVRTKFHLVRWSINLSLSRWG